MSNNLNNVIPCEFCQSLISIDEYVEHERQCLINFNISNFNSLNLYNNNINYLEPERNSGYSQNRLFEILFPSFPVVNNVDNNNENNDNVNNINNENDNNIHNINIENDDNVNNINNENGDNINNINNENDDSLNNINEESNYEIYNDETNTSFNNHIIQLLVSNLEVINNWNFNVINNQENENLFDLSDRIGYVEKGIDDINEVTTLLIDITKEERESIHCPICLESGQSKIRKTNCQHYFCDYCITNWLKKSKKCPCCMIDLEDKYLRNK